MGWVSFDPGRRVGMVKRPSGDFVFPRPPNVFAFAQAGEEAVEHTDSGGMSREAFVEVDHDHASPGWPSA